jgi:hypothetical protein
MKGNPSRISDPTDQPTRNTAVRPNEPDGSLDLTEVSILSVGLRRYPPQPDGMLTDDDDDHEAVRKTPFNRRVFNRTMNYLDGDQ